MIWVRRDKQEQGVETLQPEEQAVKMTFEQGVLREGCKMLIEHRGHGIAWTGKS